MKDLCKIDVPKINGPIFEEYLLGRDDLLTSVEGNVGRNNEVAFNEFNDY